MVERLLYARSGAREPTLGLALRLEYDFMGRLHGS